MRETLSIDIENESLLTLAQAAKRIPGRPSLRTVWRWCLKGVDGHRLENVKVGSRRYTSVEAIRRFVERGTNTASAQPSAARHRQRDVDRAEAELAEAGY